MTYLRGSFLLAMVAASSTAFAAPLAVIDGASGRVSIQTNKGIAPARKGAGLTDGSRVITGPKGTAVVSFISGKCAGKHEVPAGSIAIVSAEACLQFAKDVSAADLPSLKGPPPPPVVEEEPFHIDPWLVGGGAVLLGGAIACAVACGNNGVSTNGVFPVPVVQLVPTSPLSGSGQ